MVRANLGLPPWDVFHQGLANTLNLTLGIASIVTAFGVLLFWIPLREKPGFGTIANAIVVGVAVDVGLALIDEPNSIWARWAILLAGLIIVALGSGLYLGVRLGSGPRDGLMTGIARRGPSLRLTRTVIEALAFAVGWILGGTVGVGTLVFMLGIGPLVQLFVPWFDVNKGRDPIVKARGR
jgi:uncharacterized membrane protein YczE